MCYFFPPLACLVGPGEFFPVSYSLMIAPVDSRQCPILVGGLRQVCKPIQLWRARLQGAGGWDDSLLVRWWHLGHLR